MESTSQNSSIREPLKRVFGDGWVGLLQVGQWLSEGCRVEWRRSNPIGVECVTASLGDWESAELFSSIARHFGIETGPCREHVRALAGRSKSWVPFQSEELEEWDAMDRVLMPAHEFGFEVSLMTLLTELKRRIETHAGVHWETSDVEPDSASGATRINLWSVSEIRKLKPFGILQLAWDHPQDLWSPEIVDDQTLSLTLTRDSGDSVARNVVGRLTGQRTRSIWSAAVSSEELADHPAIVRKMRKIKQGITKSFLKGVAVEETAFQNERVVALDHFLLSPSAKLKKTSGGHLLTDGVGLSGALKQIAAGKHSADSRESQAVDREFRLPSEHNENTL